jgi:glycosyltransferase involved in cell wall biosynthesis
MTKKLIYLTYQTFPADTANSLQTITMLKYFSRSNYQVKLVFPDRSDKSSGKIEVLQKHYHFDEIFEVELYKHNLLFKDYKGKTRFKKFRFHISHYLWSFNAVRKVLMDNESDVIYFTRSDWVFYFLSKQDKNVTFEYHQTSKLRKFIISRSIKHANSKIVFTNELLKNDIINKDLFKEQILIAHNSYDGDLFKGKNKSRVNNKVIFVGNLLRFDEERGVDLLIDIFNDKRLKQHTLEIVGGPENTKNELKQKLKNSNIHLSGKKNRVETIESILTSYVGVLINTSDNRHSTHHTSPLKFFEYLRSGLNVVAVDFPSHRNLPFSEQIYFFKEKDSESLIRAILEASKEALNTYSNLDKHSYEERANTILKFMARPEGLEPPTL